MQKWMPITPDLFYLIYLLFVALSTLWSVSPSDTLAHLGFLTVIWISTMIIAGEDMLDFCKSVIMIGFWVGVVSLIAAVIAPRYAYQPKSSSGGLPEMRGILLHQLRFGLDEGLALGLLVLARLNGEAPAIVRSVWSFRFVALILAICTVLALARLYTLFLLISFACTILMSRRGYLRWLTVVSIGIFITLVMVNQEAVLSGLEAEGVDTGLTGRVLIWHRTLAVADLNPILGYGYATFTDPSFRWVWRGNYLPPHPHNSYIQAYFETGLIGLGLVITFVLSHVNACFRYGTSERRFSYSLFLVLNCLLGSLTGANYAAKPSLLFGYTLLAVGIEVRSGRLARRRNAERLLNPASESDANAVRA